MKNNGADYIPPLWTGQECWIIGGGYSLIEEFEVPYDLYKQIAEGQTQISALSPYLEPLQNQYVIGTNLAYQLGDWVDVLYFSDCSFFLYHQNALSQFGGMKFSSCKRFQKNKSRGVRYLPKHPELKTGLTDMPGHIIWNYNSGFAAINLALHMGATRIVLVAFDMRNGPNGETHWHGGHAEKVDTRKGNPYKRHLKGARAIAQQAKKRGVEIINATPRSSIEAFPKCSVKELFYG